MKKSLLVLLAVPFLWLGCSSGPYLPESDPQSHEAVGRRIVLLDEDLEDAIAVDRHPVVQRNGKNLLVVQVALRNQTSKTLQIQVQTLFKDSKGMVLYSEVGNEAAWQSMVLSANETQSITQTSLTPQATQYTMRVRLMHRPQP
ncbi:MAG: YcfL family protein [Verrucomicrobiota bacterium]